MLTTLDVPPWIQMIVLAIVQGIAEFLPVSSSGHIVTISEVFSSVGKAAEKADVSEITIVLHAGTLLSILVFYHKEIWRLLRSDKRVVGLMAVGTIPAVVVGLSIKRYFEWISESPWIAGACFILTAGLLLLLPRLTHGKKKYQEISPTTAFLIGIFQAIAILPGISRSGSTIVAGCLSGLKRNDAATFSFLLAIPAILGAMTLEARDLLEKGASTSPFLLALGFVVSAIIGWLSLAFLVRLLGKGKLQYFAFYLIPLGVAVLVWMAVKG